MAGDVPGARDILLDAFQQNPQSQQIWLAGEGERDGWVELKGWMGGRVHIMNHIACTCKCHNVSS